MIQSTVSPENPADKLYGLSHSNNYGLVPDFILVACRVAVDRQREQSGFEPAAVTRQLDHGRESDDLFAWHQF